MKRTRCTAALALTLGLHLPSGLASQQIEPARFELGDFTLESGEVIEDAFLRYATLGGLAADGSNAVLLPSAFLGTLAGYNRFIGPGRPLDPERHFIVLVEIFGSGGSSSPSNAVPAQRGATFPIVTIRDNVAAQHRLVTEGLGLSRLQAVIGFSMGAQQAFQWAVSHPDLVEVIVPIAGTAKTYPHGVVRLESALTLITEDPAIRAGADTLTDTGKRAWGLHWQAWIYSTAWWRRELFRSESVPDVEALLQNAEALAPSARPHDYRIQARAWQSHDVGETPGFEGVEDALRSIRARVVYVPVESDMYFPATDARYEARFLGDVDLRPLPSIWGHMAGNGITAEDRAFLADAMRSALERGSSGEEEAAELTGITARLEAEATRVLGETDIPAISMALIRSGEVVWADAFGHANVAMATAATADTYFSTGSTLKPVTAAAVMQLVDDGRLSLDEPVNELLGPDAAIPGADDVTLRHLLAHHAGVEGPVETVDLWDRGALPTPEGTLAATSRTTAPGGEYRYCNECYTLAGRVVELVSGMSFDAYLADRIFAPLGVEVTAPSRPTPEVVERLALPYGAEEGATVPIAQIRTNVFAAGDAYLRPADMAAFLAMLLNGGTYGGRRVLSEGSAREIMRTQYEGSSSGLGINGAQLDGRPVVTKNGIFTGYHSHMIGDPDTGHGVYVVANSTEAGRVVAELARLALRLLWAEGPDRSDPGRP